MTPIVAARMSSGAESVSTKTTPAMTIRTAPTTSTRRRPNRSACVVSHSEMNVSPTSVRVSTTPIASGVESERSEVQDEDDGEEPVAEHPQGPHREQQAAVPVEAAEARDEAGIGTWRPA